MSNFTELLQELAQQKYENKEINKKHKSEIAVKKHKSEIAVKKHKSEIAARHYQKNKTKILAKKKEKYWSDDKYSLKTKEISKKYDRNKGLAKKATMEKLLQVLKQTKRIITLGSEVCKLTDDETNSIYDGFCKFRDYDDLTIHYLSLCNIDSEGENHGVVGYQIQIEKYTQAVAKIINHKKLHGGKFLEALEVLVLFCKKYEINTVEILVRN